MCQPVSKPSYFEAMKDLDEAVDDALAAIRAEEAEGRITAVQAAAERVSVLERHLAECRRLRMELGHV
ncbi:MAG: hypothetical protein ACRDS0_39750 [Pseudonocardiaceae bacterium]